MGGRSVTGQRGPRASSRVARWSLHPKHLVDLEGSTSGHIGNAQVDGNTGGRDGGGIYSDGGTVSMAGKAHVDGNLIGTCECGGDGGGIYSVLGSTLIGVIAGVNVKSNVPDDVAP